MARSKFQISVVALDSKDEQAQKELATLTDWLICAMRDLDEAADVLSESKELDASSEFIVEMDPLK